MRCFRPVLLYLLACQCAVAASKPHVVAFGTATHVQIYTSPSEDKTVDITVRSLYVDTKLKEFTTGSRHDVTDRLFVMRRAFRLSDSLPEDPPKHPKWVWQRGGWLLVDRVSGKVTLIKLPDFDAYASDVSWYRDYAAYCGSAEGSETLYAVVAQIGARKALYRKSLGKPGEARCSLPRWERHPPRVTFAPPGGEKFTVNVSGRPAEIPEAPADEPQQ